MFGRPGVYIHVYSLLSWHSDVDAQLWLLSVNKATKIGFFLNFIDDSRGVNVLLLNKYEHYSKENVRA